MLQGGRVRAWLWRRRSSTSCGATVRGRVGVRGARAERRHRAPPLRRHGLGSVPSVVPPEDADAGDVRACYPATATCPEPRQDPAGRDIPGAPRPDHRHSGKL
jgi:hypothetical protein